MWMNMTSYITSFGAAVQGWGILLFWNRKTIEEILFN